MSKIINIYLKITDNIKEDMDKGLNFEAARRQAFNKYEVELKLAKRHNILRGGEFNEKKTQKSY